MWLLWVEVKTLVHCNICLIWFSPISLVSSHSLSEQRYGPRSALPWECLILMGIGGESVIHWTWLANWTMVHWCRYSCLSIILSLFTILLLLAFTYIVEWSLSWQCCHLTCLVSWFWKIVVWQLPSCVILNYLVDNARREMWVRARWLIHTMN